jgi:hypothetical protein
MSRTIRPVPTQTARASDRGTPSPGESSAAQPCAVCGEETAVGSVFFSDRHTIEHTDGRRTWLCTLCNSRIRSSRRRRPLTDDEVRTLVESGSLLNQAWWRV